VRGERIGIYGGTFDPPHQGHLIVAAEAFELLDLTRLLLIPAARSPHKQAAPRASAEQRLRMLRAAVAGDPRFEVDDMELRREPPSFTIDTIRELGRRHPEAELVLLLGTDQFREFGRWHEPEAIASLATLAVLSRAGETLEGSGSYEAVPVPVSRIDISATAVRARIAAGLSSRFYVAEAVREIIEGEAVYRPG
jgi:nicotinate-nucleotide adenylyltransferase